MLRLTWLDNGTRRGDLLLTLGSRHFRGDSLGLAPDLPDESPATVRATLCDGLLRIVTQWKAVLTAAAPGQTLDLAFDFSDQPTRFLRCCVGPHALTLQLCRAHDPAVQMPATSSAPLSADIPESRLFPESPPCTASRAEVLRSLDANQHDLEGLPAPARDPTPVFELFRGSYGAELLTAAVAHFNLFGLLQRGPLLPAALREALGLAERPAAVLTTALRAMRLLDVDDSGRFALTPMAEEHLAPGGPFDVGHYVGLAAASPGVLEMVERLRTNRPAGADPGKQGTAYIYREGQASAMEQAELARHFTLALAGRAKNVAPLLAARVDLRDARLLIDVAGGTGIYSVALLARYPTLRAIVVDRPEVLRVAAEFAVDYGVADRIELRAGDMFHDPLPSADVVLLSNVLHDWDVPECHALVSRCAAALVSGGRLLIHDVFLNDALDGPLPIALYSAALFTLTEGRAYSQAEYRAWMQDAGLRVGPAVPTLVHCGVLSGEQA